MKIWYDDCTLKMIFFCSQKKMCFKMCSLRLRDEDIGSKDLINIEFISSATIIVFVLQYQYRIVEERHRNRYGVRCKVNL